MQLFAWHLSVAYAQYFLQGLLYLHTLHTVDFYNQHCIIGELFPEIKQLIYSVSVRSLLVNNVVHIGDTNTNILVLTIFTPGISIKGISSIVTQYANFLTKLVNRS